MNMNGSGDARAAESSLPPELWGKVLNYLPYKSIVSCAATSRSTLQDVIPFVETVYIEHSSQLRVTGAVFRRLRDVRDVFVYSLLREDHNEGEEGSPIDEFSAILDHDSVFRSIPFLSRLTKNLERVYFGGMRCDGEIGALPKNANLEYSGENALRMFSLIDAVCGAYGSGLIPARVQMFGLCCPYRDVYDLDAENDCTVCERAIRGLPVGYALEYDHCLDSAQARSIVDSLQGGQDFLLSKSRFLQILRSGGQSRTEWRDGARISVTWYGDEVRHELQRIASSVSLADLRQEEALRAVMASFCVDGRNNMPPKENCYLEASSLNFLNELLGLSIQEDEFLLPGDDFPYQI